MKHSGKKIRCLVTWAALASLGSQTSAWAGKSDLDSIFIFGGSLADSGNVYVMTGQTAQAPYAIVPDFPYDVEDDSFQYSNDKTWAWRMTKALNRTNSGKPALAEPGKNGNYAFGRARARPDSGSPMPSGPEQVELYLADHGGKADANARYFIQIGGNDIRDALDVLLRDPANLPGAMAVVQQAIEAEAGMIARLYFQDARKFSVLTVPPVSRAPAVILAGPGAQFAARLLVDGYNAGLELALQNLEAMLPGVAIDRVDFHAMVSNIADHPADFGLENVESTCIAFFLPGTPICAEPEKFMFWDGIHATGRVHRIVGEQIAAMYR